MDFVVPFKGIMGIEGLLYIKLRAYRIKALRSVYITLPFLIDSRIIILGIL
jgi:hypothetical protein